MTAQPFKILRETPTFANLFRTLPTVLTASLFMLSGLLEVALACLKWILFVLIITATFLLGMGLLVVSVLVLVGVLMGLAKDEGGDEARENVKQDVHAERKVEQEEALLQSDNEEMATHSPAKTFADLDTSGAEETEDDLEELWTKTTVEMGEDKERDALQRANRSAVQALQAAIRYPSPSPERRTQK